MSMELTLGSVVKHPSWGQGVVVSVNDNSNEIYFNELEEIRILGNTYQGLKILDAKESSEQTHTTLDIEETLERILHRWNVGEQIIPLGDRWVGGMLVLEPKDPNLQAKEIPIETFFHKIVMLRDRLRVLEQNINSHKKLDDEDKVHLQQYITRAYGSLTTFNVLFEEKGHYFKGSGKK